MPGASLLTRLTWLLYLCRGGYYLVAIPHTIRGFSFFPCEITLHARQVVLSYLLFFFLFILPFQTIFFFEC